MLYRFVAIFSTCLCQLWSGTFVTRFPINSATCLFQLPHGTLSGRGVGMINWNHYTATGVFLADQMQRSCFLLLQTGRSLWLAARSAPNQEGPSHYFMYHLGGFSSSYKVEERSNHDPIESELLIKYYIYTDDLIGCISPIYGQNDFHVALATS